MTCDKCTFEHGHGLPKCFFFFVTQGLSSYFAETNNSRPAGILMNFVIFLLRVFRNPLGLSKGVNA